MMRSVDFWDDRWRKQPTQDPLDGEAVQAVMRIAEGLKISSVLDYGCGIGRWSSVWSGFRYHGYDQSLVALNSAPSSCTNKPVVCDLVFTCTVLIHADDIAFREVASYARKHILAVESLWPAPPKEERKEHMRYRPLSEFVNLFPRQWQLHELHPVGRHHVMLFNRYDL